jgi:ssDNA thymidine ADP-ribosyltransferase DarT-like protein
MITDNASRPVMGHTLDKWKDYVRLYFRPRTPTQIRNEGIRPPTQQYLESHCPVPVFLLFDSVELLTRQETQFSDRSLAKTGTRAYDSAAAFIKLPFAKIYHNTAFLPDQREDIVACRHAEVIVPRHLDLGALKYVWCRSQAEKVLSFISWDRKPNATGQTRFSKARSTTSFLRGGLSLNVRISLLRTWCSSSIPVPRLQARSNSECR